MPHTDRRRDDRVPLQRRVKLICPLTGRCHGGQTRNYSAGGTLVALDTPWTLAPGQRVRIGIDWAGRQGLIRSEQMPQASVIRAVASPGSGHLALAFDQRQELAFHSPAPV